MSDLIFSQEVRPEPLLLHAYYCVNKAFQGNVAINTYTEDLKISSDNSAYQKAASKTLKDLQISYTKGTLNKELIDNIIAIHLPEELKQENSRPFYGSTYEFPKNLSKEGLKTLEQVVGAINAQCPDSCSLLFDNAVEIEASDSKTFSNIFHSLRDAQSGIEEGNKHSEKKIDYIVRNNFEEDYANLNVRAQKRKERRKQDEKSIDRVVTHKVLIINEVDGIDITPLSNHLLARGKRDDYPFSALEEHRCFAKAARDKNGIPSIRLQVPLYFKQNNLRDNDIEEKMARVVRDTAQAFNEDKNVVIDRNFISGLVKNTVNSKSFNKQASSHKYSTDEEIEAITHNDLYLTIVDWLPISIDAVLESIGADKGNQNHRESVTKIIDDFIDEGLIIQQDDTYVTPEPFSGKNIKLAVNASDTNGNVYVTPTEWDEKSHGAKPDLVIPEDMLDGKYISIYDIVTADLKYHMGAIERISITSVERLCELATDDSAVFLMDEDLEPEEPLVVQKSEIRPEQAQHIAPSHNIYIKQDAAVPADGIIAGVVRENKEKFFFKPATEGIGSFCIDTSFGLKAGDILSVRISPENRSFEEILTNHGNIHEEAGLSKLSAVEQGIPLEFPKNILEDTPPFVVPPVSKDRIDFRHIPCITIDPPTAKDFDDAIHVEGNKDGWKVMVFIADVSHYIKPDTNLFNEAYKRGNSTYLPDLTIPMLPEELSNGICSLVPDEDRACLVTTMQINHDGEITKKKFDRGLMRSICRLNYDQVQESIEGNGDEATAPIYDSHIKPAFDVYTALLGARERRGALNFNTPEQRIDMTGDEEKITLEIQNESHGIIEELMIASNICAIEMLIERNENLIARVHGLPNERVLKQFTGQLADMGVIMPPENIPVEQRVEQILEQADNSPYEDDIRRLLVRCQDRAKYRAELSEHYALKLDAYTHQTSPIRRMTDFYIHCLINDACDLKEGSRLTPDLKKQRGAAAEQFSFTERRSQAAEDKSKLRLAASWVEKRLGEEFDAAITHVTDKGMYIKFSNREIRSFIPAGELDQTASNDADSDAYYKPGKSVKVKPYEADEVTGIIRFDIV